MARAVAEHSVAGIEYARTSRINKATSARRQLVVYLAKSGAPKQRRETLESQIRRFCELVGVEYRSPKDRDTTNFLIDLYCDVDVAEIGLKSDRPYSSSQSRRWLAALCKQHGAMCVKCGAEDGLTVDHIKPFVHFPELACDVSNLQVLCRSCNSRKGSA
jgi:hypothetical protein